MIQAEQPGASILPQAALAKPRLDGLRCLPPVPPRELRSLLRYNGFTVTSEYGDFNQSPFEQGSDAQLLVCRPT